VVRGEVRAALQKAKTGKDPKRYSPVCITLVSSCRVSPSLALPCQAVSSLAPNWKGSPGDRYSAPDFDRAAEEVASQVSPHSR
jgi:hypothetical protein